jgi:AcrR family transcriptional regulator
MKDKIMSRERFFDDRQHIIDAAVSLIAEIGYENFSTRRLAAKLGISPMTLYNYFENKEEIVQATIADAYAKVLSAIQNELKEYFEGETACPLKGFVEIGRKLKDFSLQYPKMYALLFIMDLRPYNNHPSIQSRFEYAFRKTSERLLDKSIEEELHRHIYLYEVLAGALVRNLHSGHLPVDNHTFDTHLELAYDRLLKPFEQYFQECEKTR